MPKGFHKLLERIRFNVIVGYKVNSQKSIVFLYSRSKQLKIKFWKATVYNSIKQHNILLNKFNFKTM